MKFYRYLSLVLLGLLIPIFSVQASGELPSSVGAEMNLDTKGQIVSLALHPDETYLAVADDSNTFSLFDVVNNVLVSQYEAGAGNVYLDNGLSYNADGTLTAVSAYYQLYVHDGLTGELRYQISTNIIDFVFAPDGQQIYVLTGNTVEVYDALTGTLVQSISLDQSDEGLQASDLEILADGTLVLLVSDPSFDYFVTTISPDFTEVSATTISGRGLIAKDSLVLAKYYQNLTAYTELTEPGIIFDSSAICGDFTSVDINPANTLVAGLAGTCELHVYDIQSGTRIWTIGLENANGVAFGTTQIYVGMSNTIVSYEVPADVETAQQDSHPINSDDTQDTSDMTATVSYQLNFQNKISDLGFSGVATSPDGQHVVGIAGFGDYIVMYDTTTYNELGRYEGGAGSSHLEYSSDGQSVVAITADSELFVLDGTTLSLVSEAQLQDEFVRNLIVDTQYAYFFGWSSTEEGVSYLNKVELATGNVVARVQALPSVAAASLAFDINGNLRGNNYGEAKTWDADLNELTSETVAYWNGYYVETGIFFVDSRREDDVTTYIYKFQANPSSEMMTLDEGECLLPEFDHNTSTGLIAGIRFRCGLILFNLVTGEIDGQVMGEAVGSDIAFAPDGKTLYVATPEGIEVYAITPRE